VKLVFPACAIEKCPAARLCTYTPYFLEVT
jgi:hypothetical protein